MSGLVKILNSEIEQAQIEIREFLSEGLKDLENDDVLDAREVFEEFKD